MYRFPIRDYKLLSARERLPITYHATSSAGTGAQVGWKRPDMDWVTLRDIGLLTLASGANKNIDINKRDVETALFDIYGASRLNSRAADTEYG